MKKIMDKITLNKRNIIIFFIILTIISCLDLFRDGLTFEMDNIFHFHRIIAVSDNLKIGKMIPVYFDYLNGFGYANGLFYPDLFLYIPALLHSLGLNLIISVKIFIVLINFFSLITMYISIKRITKNEKCGIIGSVLYSLSLYKFTDIYLRGALGESIVFVFLPLFILGIYEIFYGDNQNKYYLTISLVGICYSHVISFYLTCFFLVAFIIINIKKLKDKDKLKNLTISILISILITSSFWVPFLEQYMQNKFSFKYFSPVYENIVPIVALIMDFPIKDLFSAWIPPGIGLCYFIVIYIFFRYQKKLIKKDKFLTTLFILGIVSIIFACCGLLWEIDIFYKIFSIIQFPWRFYLFATIFIIMATSIFFNYYKNIKLIKIVLIYVIVMFLVNTILLNYKLHINEVFYSNQIMNGEYLPDNFDINTINNYKNENIEYHRENEKTIINIKNKTEIIELPLIYYKGYKACDNEKCYKLQKSDNGLLEVNVDMKTNNLTVWYEGTTLFKMSKYISLFGLILFVIYIYYKKRRNEYSE